MSPSASLSRKKRRGELAKGAWSRRTPRLFLFLLNPAGALMPLLVTKYFERGALDLGGLESVFGIGMIGGGILLSTWGGFRRKIVTSLLGIVGIGLGVLMIGLALADMFWLAIVGHVVLGLMQPIANGPLLALVQSVVRPDMQGPRDVVDYESGDGHVPAQLAGRRPGGGLARHPRLVLGRRQRVCAYGPGRVPDPVDHERRAQPRESRPGGDGLERMTLDVYCFSYITSCKTEQGCTAAPFSLASFPSGKSYETGMTSAACRPLGPSSMVNSTFWLGSRRL
jgi:hypothetical protein